MKNVHNLTGLQRKIRLIPKNQNSKAEVSFDDGAVAESNRQVLICQDTKKSCDSLLLFTVPHVPYILPSKYGYYTHYLLMYSGIEVNGVFYNLEGVNNYHSSNIFQDIRISKGLGQWGNLFPAELASMLSICFHYEEGYYYYPNGIDTVKVLYRNKTNNRLNVKLVIKPEFKIFTKFIGTDNLNPSYKVDTNGDLVFVLDPRDETDDWLEAIVKINLDPTEAEPNRLDYFYIESFHGLDGDTTNYNTDDYFEIDWGDGSPFYKHIWSQNIGNTNRNFTDYYLMVDHTYPGPGEYNVRIRSSVMMEWVWLQGVRRLEKWGKYIGTYVYGLGVPLNWGGPDPLEYYNPEIPASVTYFQIDNFNGPLQIDMSKFDQHRTFMYCDFDNDWGSMWNDYIERPSNNGFLVWGKEVETYPQRQVNLCDFIQFTFSYDELSGSDLRVMLEDLWQSTKKISFQNPNEVPYIHYFADDANKKVTIVYDFKTWSNSTGGPYLFENLTIQFHLDWLTEVNSGKVNLNVKTYNGTMLQIENNVLVENGLTKLSDNSFIVQSRTEVTSPFSDSLAALHLSYDPYVEALLFHEGSYFSVDPFTSTIDVEMIDKELTKITGIPGADVDFIRIGRGEMLSKTITIPPEGVYNHYRSPEELIEVKNYSAIPHDAGLVANAYAEYWHGSYGYYQEISGVVSTTLPADLDMHVENQNGVIISETPIAYRAGTIIPLNKNLFQAGDDFSIVSKWSSSYSDAMMQERNLIDINVKKINQEDLLIIKIDLNLTPTPAIRVKKGAIDTWLRAEALAPNYDGFSYLWESYQGSGYAYDANYDTYLIWKHADPAPVDMIQTVAIYFINEDDTPMVDPTRVEILNTAENIVQIIQKPSWMP